jgi:universal stress protein A
LKDYKHILVTVNLANEDDDIVTLQRAKELARESGAALTVLHAIDSLRGCIAFGYSGVSDVEARLRAKASDAMAKLGAEMGIPADQQVIRIGLRKPVILEEADKLGVDLIVVGNRGHKLGSMASSVLHHAPCDTLAVHIN